MLFKLCKLKRGVREILSAVDTRDLHQTCFNYINIIYDCRLMANKNNENNFILCCIFKYKQGNDSRAITQELHQNH